MQRFGRLRDFCRLPRLFESSKPGQTRHLCQPYAADLRPIFLGLCTPVLHQFQACPSIVPGNGCPSSHPTGLPSQHGTTTALLRAAAGPASKSCHQRAPASACFLTSAQLHLTSHLTPVGVARQLHVSASQRVPPQSELLESKFQPDTAEQQQQHQSGPDISLLNATQQRHWDHARNAHLGNILIKPQGHCKADWTCNRCPSGLSHKWQASVNSVFRSSKSNNSGCPYCASKAVCAHNSLAEQAPHLLLEWDTLRNVGTPESYTSKSSHQASWVCTNGHKWQARIAHRVHYNTGCPDCAKARNRKRSPTLTDSSSHIMQIWNYAENAKADLNPSKLTCGSNRRAYFICSKGHQWTARIDTVSAITNTTGCPVCKRRSMSKRSG